MIGAYFLSSKIFNGLLLGAVLAGYITYKVFSTFDKLIIEMLPIILMIIITPNIKAISMKF